MTKRLEPIEAPIKTDERPANEVTGTHSHPSPPWWGHWRSHLAARNRGCGLVKQGVGWQREGWGGEEGRATNPAWEDDLVKDAREGSGGELGKTRGRGR